MDDRAWRAEAACRSSSPALFFPAGSDIDSIDAAKAICDNCPVGVECLEYALARREKFGIWGGQTERGRRRLLRERRLRAAS